MLRLLVEAMQFKMVCEVRSLEKAGKIRIVRGDPKDAFIE